MTLRDQILLLALVAVAAPALIFAGQLLGLLVLAVMP